MNTKCAMQAIAGTIFSLQNERDRICEFDFQGIQAKCSFAPTTMILEKLNECCATKTAGLQPGVQDP